MAVYVDELRECGPVPTFPYKYGCHMLADTRQELHAMADRLGLARSWQHDNHFDITAPKRAMAKRFGALDMPRDRREKVALIRRIAQQWQEAE